MTANPHFFPTPADLRAWFAANHATETALLVGFCKLGSGEGSVTWPEAVDEALGVGWIDGVRRRLDERAYTVRFTPRRASSIWSAVNIARVAALNAEGRMQPAGLAAFARRREDRSGVYSYEQRQTEFEEPHLSQFKSSPAAWEFFNSQPPSHRRQWVWWVVSAKQEATRQRRLARLIEASARGERL